MDTAHERVEVHTESVDSAYTRITPYRPGEIIVSSALPALRVQVEHIFR